MKAKKTKEQKVGEFIDTLKESKKSLTVKMCKNSCTIKSDGQTYFFNLNDEKTVDFKDLAFIKQVKRSLIVNSSLQHLKTPKPKYVNFINLPDVGTEIKDAVEIDISGAYWREAYNLGLINETLYLKGLTVDKLVRLMAIGAAATINDVFVYENGEMVYSGQDFNEAGRAAFFTIAANISELMHSAVWSCSDGTFFYWVDAIFCRSFYSPYICELIESKGHSYTIKDLETVIFDGEKITVSEAKGRKKTFAVSKNPLKKRQKNITTVLKNEFITKKTEKWNQTPLILTP